MKSMLIRKRNGEEVQFDRAKIEKAIEKANNSVSKREQLNEVQIRNIALEVEIEARNSGMIPSVERVQDTVIIKIMERRKYKLALAYTTYRIQHDLRRKENTTDATILSLLHRTSAEARDENSNKNPMIVSVLRDYLAGEVNKDITRRMILPQEITAAHDEGLIHFHDIDYAAQPIHNCDLVNLDDMLQNGTIISGTMIEKPHAFSTACNIATQIIAQVASSQYGGQTITLTHLAPFVDSSRQKFRKEVRSELKIAGVEPTEERVNEIAEVRVRKDIEKGVQIIQYQVVTLMTTNGQAPFISVAMYLNECGEDKALRDDLAMVIAEVLRQRIVGIKNEAGVWITPAFPKLLYFLEDDNTYEGSEYFWLTQLAVQCSIKRMVPDYISEKKMLELKGDAYPCMGCRSFLTPDRFTDAGIGNIANAGNYVPGKHRYYGRFNQGVVTVNLPFVAMRSGGDMEKFWSDFDETLELCHRALRIRHEQLKGTPSDVAPILWQHGAIARLQRGESIDKLLYNGYSTISLGYAGVYEAVKYLTGYSHTDPNGKPLALAIMQRMNDKCNEWKQAENIDYSLYGTPLESTTYKFAKALKNNFGVVEGITDHNYITNSYHVNVREEISAFDKLAFEAQFQALSPGGAISYVEIPNMAYNPEAVMMLVQYIYENIMYAELNTKSDYCQVCGFDGEIQIIEEGGKYLWECPCCGNRDQDKMNVARRTCGYIGTQFWNQGRTQEIKDRVLHVSIDEKT